ncbi:hypothetical protein [Pleionea sp. CnH1-48]|uniref:hypothetical protein n=1 Tax=Pleionea sp. CnH1-48 TaxID=2954494 RepID=UPI002097E098|nr:hypothetical protein [Pleionea sp. CnH1-48]MCO7223215.1 hypothetical protein [Pleionea sp. CnH1-48]
MKPIKTQEAVQKVKSLKLPPIICDILLEKTKDPVDIYFTCPNTYLLSDEEQLAYELGKVIPLFSTCGGGVVAYSVKNKSYLTFYLDGGVAKSNMTWNDMLIDWFEVIIEEYWETEQVLYGS